MTIEELLDYLAKWEKKHHKCDYFQKHVDVVRKEITGLREFAALKPHTMPAQVCSAVADGYEKKLDEILA